MLRQNENIRLGLQRRLPGANLRLSTVGAKALTMGAKVLTEAMAIHPQRSFQFHGSNDCIGTFGRPGRIAGV